MKPLDYILLALIVFCLIGAIDPDTGAKVLDTIRVRALATWHGLAGGAGHAAA